MAIKKGTLDQLLSGRDPKQVFSKDGLVRRAEEGAGRACSECRARRPSRRRGRGGQANHRNGYSKKTVLTGSAKLDLRIPRDRKARSIRS